ncbi:MAG: hypothetical protein U1G05_19905 [Kiritimatiellia bacterium]
MIDAAKTSTGLLYGGGFGQTVTQLHRHGHRLRLGLGRGLVIFFGIKYTIGLRVTEERSWRIDIDEHGNEAYAGSGIFSNQ